jgi:hypothetical protein
MSSKSRVKEPYISFYEWAFGNTYYKWDKGLASLEDLRDSWNDRHGHLFEIKCYETIAQHIPQMKNWWVKLVGADSPICHKELLRNYCKIFDGYPSLIKNCRSLDDACQEVSLLVSLFKICLAQVMEPESKKVNKVKKSVAGHLNKQHKKVVINNVKGSKKK